MKIQGWIGMVVAVIAMRNVGEGGHTGEEEQMVAEMQAKRHCDLDMEDNSGGMIGDYVIGGFYTPDVASCFS